MELPELHLSEFTYPLPQERIAQYPLADRAGSRLLEYRQGSISHHTFRNLPQQLPAHSHLVFNDTRVIPARLYFQRSTGAQIEIFLLHPVAPATDMASAMQATGTCTWTCMIGNLKRWKKDTLVRDLEVNGQAIRLEATLVDRDARQVKFTWTPADLHTVDWIEAAGQLPLPPYLQREVEPEDKPRYQTVYSKESGAVAAPTAGLHFTDEVLEELKAKGHSTDFLTLHVSAGTFQPIKSENVVEHTMHEEQVVIKRANLEALLAPAGPVVAVGTTALRTLESTYWYGVKLLQNPDLDFRVEKLDPYQDYPQPLPSRAEAMQAVIDRMERLGVQQLVGETEIFCFPTYQFRVVEGLITNFHLPESTLILLIAAFIGQDWRKVYEEALEKEYRFLSYGDSSLLLPHNPLF